MKVNKNMVSGNTAMLILKLISEKDMYGYEMIDTLSKRSDNVLYVCAFLILSQEIRTHFYGCGMMRLA